jgi:hypothetical protein
MLERLFKSTVLQQRVVVGRIGLLLGGGYSILSNWFWKIGILIIIKIRELVSIYAFLIYKNNQ